VRSLKEFKEDVMELPYKPNWVWSLVRPVKLWWQRRTRGWDDSELWSLDYTILKLVYPRLKAFREGKLNGTPLHPTDVYPEGHEEAGLPKALTEEEWDSILGEILVGFKMVIDADCYPLMGEQHVRLERSMDLFREWFFALWD
jgi:hypothetical protein